MKFLIAPLAALLFALQYALWFGDKSAADLYQLQRAAARAQAENVALRRGNEKLVAEVIDLKQGGETIETLARSRYGLIKENETFYQIVE